MSNPGGVLDVIELWGFAYRYRKQGSAIIQITFALIEGTTLITSTNHAGIGTDWTGQTRTLNSGQKASISDPNDLRIRVTAAGDTGTPTNADVSYIKFIIV